MKELSAFGGQSRENSITGLSLKFLTPWYDYVTCAYQGVRNVSFLENFADVLNGWPLIRNRQSSYF